MFQYKLSLKLYKDNDPHAFFGAGPATLLQHIDETQSVSKAAEAMGMAYSKALKIVRRAETALGEPLIHATSGGSGGGGSVLTEKAKALLRAYQNYRKALDTVSNDLYIECFKPVLDK